ncbi:TPA: hypothetical protein SI878_004414 [Salmonella enterica]|nr:hypothetical protein [Salmonella enterica]
MKVTKTITVTESIEVSDPIVRLQTYIPDELHRQFKAACAKNGVKMTQAVEDFVKHYVLANQ